jgi:hypothetical protein
MRRLPISLVALAMAASVPARLLAQVGAARQSGDGPALAREVFAAIDTGDFVRTGALPDDSFRLRCHGVPEPISKGTLLEMIRSYYESRRN